ncbi:hypothetical protein ABW21_db0206967 [Orbilia brochopaga]|nr:hypothetical protein ABW21_db0206967 [Drechslerella brochopaga]
MVFHVLGARFLALPDHHRRCRKGVSEVHPFDRFLQPHRHRVGYPIHLEISLDSHRHRRFLDRLGPSPKLRDPSYVLPSHQMAAFGCVKRSRRQLKGWILEARYDSRSRKHMVRRRRVGLETGKYDRAQHR